MVQQPLLSLAVSCAVAVLSIFLTWPPPDGPSELKTVARPGLLEIVWRVGHHPMLGQELVDSVDKPTPAELRKAGQNIIVPVSEDGYEEWKEGTSSVQMPSLDKEV